MKDHYPQESSIPADSLVRPEAQPEYADSHHHPVDDTSNVGRYLSDRRVELGDGEVTALIESETNRRVTFAELAILSDTVARGLMSRGIRIGDRVALRGPNTIDLVVAMIGAWKAGAAVVPIPLQSRPDELAFFVADTTPRFLVVTGRVPLDSGHLEALQSASVDVLAFGQQAGAHGLEPVVVRDHGGAQPEIPEFSSDHVALIWHTGGTTGQPKGCYHTHRRHLLGGFAVGEVLEPRRGQRWAGATPLGHALGMIYHTIFTVMHGATAVLIEDFRDAGRVLDAIERHEVNVFTAIAATWSRMLVDLEHRPRDLASLQRGYAMWQTASSSQVLAAWLERGLVLMNNYGSTAFGTWPLVPRHHERFAEGVLGKPLDGYDVQAVRRDSRGVEVLDLGMGQMAVKGLTGLTYWNRPDLQSRDVVDGWSLCDDLIEFDGSGNAAYLGRTDYMISTAGFKVAPVEVESVLSTHRAVREVSVLGAPDHERGEVVVAFVSLEDGHEGDEALRLELQTLAKERLSPYKYPRRVQFVDALPRDAVGKIQGGVLKQWAAATAPQNQGVLT